MQEKKTSLPGPITILMIVIVLAAIATWILPAGQYKKLSVENNSFQLTTATGPVRLPYTQHTLDSLGLHISIQKFINGDLRKPISVPGTYQQTGRNPQGFIQILQAPIKGIYDSIDIILFILTIGGFMSVFDKTGALVTGITYLSQRMKRRMPLLIGLLIVLFSLGGASYGMAEEAFAFYPLIVPLLLAAGYDLIVPLAILFGGTTVGTIAAFSNPFSTIIASNAAGFNWMDGFYERLTVWALATGILVIYVIRYAARVKKDPSRSIVYKTDGHVQPAFETGAAAHNETVTLSASTKLLLVLYAGTFITMITGVIALGWWTLEMSALFIGASILVALISRIKEKDFISQFIRGAEGLLNVAFIVGIARGVTVVLNDGHITDSILYYTANLVQDVPPAIFVLLLLAFFFLFGIVISSTSGMAVLTMPIIGALALIVNIPGREVVNAYQYGMNLMAFITPTGLILPALALLNVSLKAWVKFVLPLLFFIFLLCAGALLWGVYAR